MTIQYYRYDCILIILEVVLHVNNSQSHFHFFMNLIFLLISHEYSTITIQLFCSTFFLSNNYIHLNFKVKHVKEKPIHSVICMTLITGK